MLSKNLIKHINSLKQKKFRLIEQKFVCEGEKIFELLYNSTYIYQDVIATKDYIYNNKNKYNKVNFIEATEDEISKITSLTTPQKVMAVVNIPAKIFDYTAVDKQLTLVLDNIQDPGNLGTIIRIADWFGIKSIVCSDNTVDVFNPKVIQATMGSLFTTNIFYTDLQHFIEMFLNTDLKIYGTLLEGENIYTTELFKTGIIVLGNEANGISEPIKKLVNHKITIPDFNKTKAAESLNVAVSAAIVCSEFARRK